MGNQQPSVYRKEQLFFLGLNAKFGDGCFWKHPECVNAKLCYTSTTPELLGVKRAIAPDMFPSGISVLRKAGAANAYANAKTLYGLTSLVHPLFTQMRGMRKVDLIPRLSLQDFALWYLDDGCFITRHDGPGFRFFLCIGDTCQDEESMTTFVDHIKRLFGPKVGHVKKNNSKATEKNKTWVIANKVAYDILEESVKYGILPHKFPPTMKVQRLSREGVGFQG